MSYSGLTREELRKLSLESTQGWEKWAAQNLGILKGRGPENKVRYKNNKGNWLTPKEIQQAKKAFVEFKGANAYRHNIGLQTNRAKNLKSVKTNIQKLFNPYTDVDGNVISQDLINKRPDIDVPEFMFNDPKYKGFYNSTPNDPTVQGHFKNRFTQARALNLAKRDDIRSGKVKGSLTANQNVGIQPRTWQDPILGSSADNLPDVESGEDNTQFDANTAIKNIFTGDEGVDWDSASKLSEHLSKIPGSDIGWSPETQNMLWPYKPLIQQTNDLWTSVLDANPGMYTGSGKPADFSFETPGDFVKGLGLSGSGDGQKPIKDFKGWDVIAGNILENIGPWMTILQILSR